MVPPAGLGRVLARDDGPDAAGRPSGAVLLTLASASAHVRRRRARAALVLTVASGGG